MAKVFPVLGSVRASHYVREAGDLMVIVNVPIEMMRAREALVVQNHGRTVDMLIEDGGLRADQVLAVLLGVERINWKDDAKVHRTLCAEIAQWRKRK